MAAPSSERWAAIAPVFDAALDLAPELRSAFLAERCATDPDLGREVERLLVASEAVGTFLTDSAWVFASPLVARMARDELLAPGDGLGGYRIEREVGRGGMATLYPAHDTRHDRQVAFKVFDRELASALGADRFVREPAFPSDLLSQAARRLRVLALLYAFVFFMAGIFPALLFPADRAWFLSSILQWGPSVFGIVVALTVAALIRSPRLSLSAAMRLGVAFEIASSYAIAASEFGDPMGLENHPGYLGLSWVAVWVMLFTVVVPTAPRRALAAALASVSAVPVIIGFMIRSGATSLRLNPAQFFFGLIFPYLLVVGMAYVGARVVYHLGTEIKRARELGSYYLEEKLGEGGMGEVWRARHRMLARPAAIKLIRRSLTSEVQAGVSGEAVRRFEREAQVIARLRSPHTVELFDFGLAADGVFYYVMELLDGLDADSLLRRYGPMPPERAVFLLRQVCHSLSEAQACGLVHRDIKPANIFVCRYGEEYDFVKVLDFGIVGAVRKSADPSLVHAGENQIQGTPAFMAPEQAMGREVDGRADIYATGCLAYWLLTGQLVFSADSPTGHLMHHARTPPPAPSSRTGQRIPAALDELVLSCLAKDPAHRPQTARELSHRLGELDGAGTWTQDRAREWWRTIA